ncbi:MAG: hypothetical protein GXY49_14280 [Syntrophomonadaceae bacterium]|nr:hypothetical protein [Syntrophomonadaceae bacterium]
MAQNWVPEGWIGVKEAAKRLGVADKTIRRKIESGELTAKLIPSPYGRDMWVVLSDQIQTAQKIIEVIEVKQEYELHDVALALSEIIKERDAERDAKFEEQLQQLAQQMIHHIQQPVLAEMQQLREENTRLYEMIDKRLAERDAEVVAQIREKQEVKKSSWWPFGK